MDKKEIYLFDLCGTLYFSNTTYDFLLWYFKKYNRIKFLKIKLALSLPFKIIWVTSKRIGLKFDIRKILIGTLKGEMVSSVYEEAYLFVGEFLKNRENPQIHELFNEAKRKGADMILVSASIDPVVRAVSNQLRFKNYLATTLEKTAEGVFSGNITKDLQGYKLEALQKEGIDFYQETTLATDNVEDLQLAKACKNVYIITKKRKIGFWERKKEDHWKITYV
ncbi:HAD-IB family phosphatase [Cecembia lonarensis]|nr:HAD-IB family phosphatase [Cecembia lonarensis]